MSGELEAVLRLVAEGRLTAEEAAPIVAALQERRGARTAETGAGNRAGSSRTADRERGGDRGPNATAERRRPGAAEQALGGRRFRLYVGERGRSVVDLKIPLGTAGFAIDQIPGLSADNRARIIEALRLGMTGPILEVDDDGDEVRIVIE